VTLLAFNKPDAIKELWDVVRSVYAEQEYQVIAARRFREAMMKASILVGFPLVLPRPLQTLIEVGNQRSCDATRLLHR
jgi:hypothetical protein